MVPIILAAVCEPKFHLILLPFFSTYHRSRFTYSAIVLAVLSFLFSLASHEAAIIIGAIVMIAVMCTMCCRVHRGVLLTAALLAIAAAIVNFVFAADTDKRPKKVASIIGGLLWLTTSFLVYKIPETDTRTRNNNVETTGVQMEGHELA